MGESGEGARRLREGDGRRRYYKRQRELLADVLQRAGCRDHHRGRPGRKAPVLITTEMARSMQPGSVIVDIAAERGGNCELTQAGETVVHNGVHHPRAGEHGLPALPTTPARCTPQTSSIFLKN